MIFIIMFIVLGIADLITTSIGLLKGVDDINPLVNISFQYGIWVFIIFKVVVTFGVAWFFYDMYQQGEVKKRFSRWILVGLNALLFAVVISNLVVILR